VPQQLISKGNSRLCKELQIDQKEKVDKPSNGSHYQHDTKNSAKSEERKLDLMLIL
jgi:hypothetical protein